MSVWFTACFRFPQVAKKVTVITSYYSFKLAPTFLAVDRAVPMSGLVSDSVLQDLM